MAIVNILTAIYCLFTAILWSKKDGLNVTIKIAAFFLAFCNAVIAVKVLGIL